ncbi:DUF6516 family protein [Sphaerospermopsis sp. LEGE 00249]|uniref:toxin-antitoxin system TumE family protein n=1 Tax=Sphaerospermopsis sp. LEGE 00249 TaxID=1380707 RepID=UPI001C9B9C01|nr:DUF6516 family protein [Sphaerospermopsis sp. LEGE 00249]
MSLNNYQADILVVIQKYLNQGWIISFNFSLDARSNYVGFIQVNLDFLRGSRLFFKEYIDLQESLEKLSYSFHYQDNENNLIFRYDGEVIQFIFIQEFLHPFPQFIGKFE